MESRRQFEVYSYNMLPSGTKAAEAVSSRDSPYLSLLQPRSAQAFRDFSYEMTINKKLE